MTFQETIAYNNARLCPKMFLTQRTIQSFIFLLAECRDPHSGKLSFLTTALFFISLLNNNTTNISTMQWIEDFLGVQNLGNYHGTGAFNVTKYPTWDSILLDMMRQKN
eukprot:scaffold13804_cov290-Alexandrium_tamarense.AAC.1